MAAQTSTARQLSTVYVLLLWSQTGWIPATHAETFGNVYYGTGAPPKTTFLLPPVTSPFASPVLAPSYAQALAPGTVQAANAPLAGESFAPGPCYCTPIVGGRVACFVNDTLSPSATTTTTECDPPLAYDCIAEAAPAGLYAQSAGTAYNCSAAASRGSGGGSSTTVAAPVGPPVNAGNYTLVFQANSSAPSPDIQFARTPLLEAGQTLSVNPQPVSIGLSFPGADITTNGQLNGIPLEPPNPSICVGNGFVLEATNDVLVVYSAANGTTLAGPTDFQHFLGVSGPPHHGLSDTYCLYDAADSQRFFVSISFFSCRTAACLARGVVPIFSYMLIAVSRTSDPRDGFYGPYFVATDGINPNTNEPYPGFGDCGITPPGFTGKGCLGDFPNPALDKNGFWFSMNMFTIDADNLIGANVFGVRKADLLTGRVSNPSVVTYTDWAPYPGFTIMPSITQATWNHSAAQNGSLFLMSSDSFSYTGQNNDSLGIPSLRTWAITNTILLGQNFPGGRTPSLSAPVTLATEALQFPTRVLANRAAPSGTSVSQPYGPILGAQDERMRQVAFSGGYLYSCLNTPLNITSRIYMGLAYFVLAPNFTADGRYTARIVDQGYVGTAGVNLLNGALTAAANGSMVIAGSAVGTGMYLSAFYAHILPRIGPGPVHIPRPSTHPLLNEGPGQLPQRRTGDYSVATLDERGRAWIVAEWASDRTIRLRQPDTGNPRLANWGTYVIEVDPYVRD